jgi:hypothetical protein
VEFGGTVEAANDIGLAVMVRDPDGQLIELLTMEYAQRCHHRVNGHARHMSGPRRA